jgi:hypothetical protein
MADRRTRPGTLPNTRAEDLNRMLEITEEEEEGAQPIFEEDSIISVDMEVQLATQAFQNDEASENVQIVSHRHYTASNIEFTLDTIHSMQRLTNPWMSKEKIIQEMPRLPVPLVQGHWTFFFDFLERSDMIQSRGMTVKTSKPGLRTDRRIMTDTCLLLTLFTVNEKLWELELLEDYLRLHCTYGKAGQETCPTTGRIHIHAFVQYKHVDDLKWLKIMFPTLKIKNRIQNQVATHEYTI